MQLRSCCLCNCVMRPRKGQDRTNKRKMQELKGHRSIKVGFEIISPELALRGALWVEGLVAGHHVPPRGRMQLMLS